MPDFPGSQLPGSAPLDPREALQEVLRAVRRNLARVIFSVLVVGMLGLALTMVWPAKFESSTVFVLRERSIVTDQELLKDLEEIPLSRKLRTLENELRSRRRIEDVLNELQWVEWLETAGHASRRRKLALKIADNLGVEMRADTLGDHHITMSFRWTSPRKAAAFVNKMRDSWIELTQKMARSRLEDEWKRKEEVVKSRRDEYQRALDSLRTYDHEHNVAALLSSENLSAQKVQLELELTVATGQLEMSYSNRDRFEEELSAIDPDVMVPEPPDNPELVKLRVALTQQVMAAHAKLAKLSDPVHGYTERHPTRIQAQEEVDDLVSSLEAAGGPPDKPKMRKATNPAYASAHQKLQQARADVREMQAQVRVYTEDLGKVTTDLQRLPFIEHDRAELRRAVAVTSQLLTQAEQELQPLGERVRSQRAAGLRAQTQRDELLGGGPYEILEIGVEPENAVMPVGAVIMAMSLLLGVGLGVALPVVQELTRSSFSSTKEVSRTLGVPVLAAVDLILTGRDVRARSVQQALALLTMVLVVGAMASGLYIYAYHREVLPAAMLRTVRDVTMALT